jgi:hypothetical protein
MTSEGVLRLAVNTSHSFLLNILLNAWEEENVDLNTKQRNVMHMASRFITGQPVAEPTIKPHNDRSACSCLKDCASPLSQYYDTITKSVSMIRAWNRMLKIIRTPINNEKTLVLGSSSRSISAKMRKISRGGGESTAVRISKRFQLLERFQALGFEEHQHQAGNGVLHRTRYLYQAPPLSAC